MNRRREIRQQQLRARLKAIADDRLAAAEREAEIRAELHKAITDASEAGLSAIEIAECSGISRRAVYDVLRSN